MTKAELFEEAERRGLEPKKKMNKGQLEALLASAPAQTEPAAAPSESATGGDTVIVVDGDTRWQGHDPYAPNAAAAGPVRG